MADRSVKVRLEANVEGFRSAMSTAAKAVQDFDKRSQGYIQHHKASINELSTAAMGIGASMLAASGLAAKAAMDWESAWAGVTKTVDGTDAQMASLEAGLRDMAKELPATHAEIAAVAEAAGQLGIEVPNIESFTRTMIDLGEATNMTAEEGAVTLARFMNIMGTSQDDVDRLGSSIVGLGNNFETTESEILEMALRLAGTSNQIGLTEGEVLGLATAMSSVGIEAQAGGTAMSMGMRKINDAVEEGGESLQAFADVAGMSADEFSRLWAEDPAAGLEAFVMGLERVSAEGGNVAGVLDDLGIKGIRESDTFLRLAGSAQGFGDAMAMGNEAFDENIALAEEAANRYETAESRIAMMRNAFVDLGIDMGGAVAPALADAADTVSVMIERFQELPDAAKSALGTGAGVAGISLLAVGALGKAVTAASDLKLSLNNLGVATDGLGRKFKLLGAATVAGLAITGLTVAIGNYFESVAEAEGRTTELADTLDELTGAATAATGETIIAQLSDQLDKGDWEALEEIGLSQADLAAAVLEGGAAYDDAIAKLEEYALAQDGVVASGRNAEDAYQKAIDAMQEQSGALEEGREKIQQTQAAQEELAGSSEMSAEAQQALTSAVEETGVELDGTIEKLDTFIEKLFEAGLLTMSARDAQAAYHDSVSEVGAAVEEITNDLGGLGAALNENKTDFDLTTEAGRIANEAFQGIARSGMDVVTSMAEAGASQDELQGKLNTTYDDLIAAAGQFGITGDAAEDLAREVLGIPDGVDIETWMDDEAEKQAKETARALDGIDRYINIVTRYTTRGTRPPVGSHGPPVPQLANADGNVYPSVKAFANGSENHVAQIAPAGAWRLWAEPETGGEAYIPLAQSKRARSEEILADVAGRFGMGLQKFDNGGMVMPYEPRRPAPAAPAVAQSRAPFAPIIQGPDAYAVAREAYGLYRHEERLETAEL